MDEGDLVIVAGYPGRTFCYRTADEVQNFAEFVYPTTIRYLSETIRLLEEAGKESRDVQIRNSSRINSLSNALKNYTSVTAGFAKDKIVDVRRSREGVIADAVKAVNRIHAERVMNRESDLVLDFMTGRGSPMLGQAVTIVRMARERTRKDIDRVPRCQERNWASLRQASERAQRTMHASSDRALHALGDGRGRRRAGVDAGAGSDAEAEIGLPEAYIARRRQICRPAAAFSPSSPSQSSSSR